MKTRNLLAIAIAALLISCEPEILEGEVFEKDFHPSHTTIQMIPITTTNGKITTTRIIPMVFFYPDAWHISYQKFNEKRGEWDRATVWVSHECFDAVQVGAWYERTDEAMDEQPKVRR